MGFLLTNCSIETKKQVHPDYRISEFTSADSVWIVFREALQQGQIEYLLSNSFDSIQCIDCLPDSLKTINEIYDSRLIYRQHLRELMHLDSLNNYDFSTFQNDTMFYVSYSIEWKYAEEGSYGLHYIFKKNNDKYLFSGMITIP